MTEIWSSLNVGDVFSFVNDPAVNLYVKCSPDTMHIVKSNGPEMDMGNRDNELCTVYGNAASLGP